MSGSIGVRRNRFERLLLLKKCSCELQRRSAQAALELNIFYHEAASERKAAASKFMPLSLALLRPPEMCADNDK